MYCPEIFSGTINFGKKMKVWSRRRDDTGVNRERGRHKLTYIHTNHNKSSSYGGKSQITGVNFAIFDRDLYEKWGVKKYVIIRKNVKGEGM
jgi:hypothetical protein